MQSRAGIEGGDDDIEGMIISLGALLISWSAECGGLVYLEGVAFLQG